MLLRERFLCICWVKSGTGAGESELPGQWADVTDSGNRVMEHGIHRKSHWVPEKKKAPD